MCYEIHDYDGGHGPYYVDNNHGYLLSIEKGKWKIKTLKHCNKGHVKSYVDDFEGWKKELEQKGYTLIWEAK